MNSLYCKNLTLTLAAAVGLTLVSSLGHSNDFLSAQSVEGLLGCDLQSADAQVVFSEFRGDGELLDTPLQKLTCGQALAWVKRRRDIKVAPAVGASYDRDSLIFQMSGPASPAPRSLSCAVQKESVEGTWINSRTSRRDRVMPATCVEQLSQAAMRQYQIGDPVSIDTHDFSDAEESLLFEFSGEATGYPDRPYAVIACGRDADNVWRVRLVDGSAGYLRHLEIKQADECASARSMMRASTGLDAASMKPAVLESSTDGTHDRVYYHVSSNKPNGQPRVHSCANVPESAPAGDLLVVTDPNGRLVRTQPLTCSLLGASSVLDEHGNLHEVVVSADLIRKTGGVERFTQENVQMNCKACITIKQEEPLPNPGELPSPSQMTTPGVVNVIGFVGGFPFGYLPSYGADWHVSNYPPPSGSNSSYCRWGGSEWGILTNGYGWEVDYDANTGTTFWGNNAYQAYDAWTGWIRVANVYSIYQNFSNYDARLRLARRIDTCGY
ncbi:MAG: hypothetical protein AAF529_07915 [Pseudomonadota bacterium]